MDDRIACCVPFCRRTAPKSKFPDCTEIICGKHARMSSRTLRLRYRRLFRRYRRNLGGMQFWDYPAGSAKRLEGVRLVRLLDTLWERYKRSAIEAAGGI